MEAGSRLLRKAHEYEVLAASHSEREALVGWGSISLLRLRSPSPRSCECSVENLTDVGASLASELDGLAPVDRM